MMDELDAPDRPAPVRANFRLRGRDRAAVDLRGITTVLKHAQELIASRLAPAEPRNDGKQTPYRGHPVFIAQHATATCCRTCLGRDPFPLAFGAVPKLIEVWRESPGKMYCSLWASWSSR
ncbi:MAG: DUF4186 family protein [Actinomycetota bacterium]